MEISTFKKDTCFKKRIIFKKIIQLNIIVFGQIKREDIVL